MLTTINGIEDLKARAGEDVGVSDWYEVTQDGIDAFADATSDHQWIHVDPERAFRSSMPLIVVSMLFSLSVSRRSGSAAV
jgi:acyl dehydratase